MNKQDRVIILFILKVKKKNARSLLFCKSNVPTLFSPCYTITNYEDLLNHDPLKCLSRQNKLENKWQPRIILYPTD